MTFHLGEHPYASFLHKVRKPAQYIGGEHGQKRKDWAEVDCRMCLAFPDLYEIGMSHLGYKILYGIVNGDPKLLAERAYAPWGDMEAELRARGEHVRSLESARALRDFDIVGFSLQFELTYTNVLLMLDLGGIPRWSEERADDDPLVVAGGPTATHPEPLAPFVDAFLIGDGEEKVPELMRVWAELRDAKVPRLERLQRIASLGGFYVPRLYGTVTDPETGFEVVAANDDSGAPFPVRRAFVEKLSDFPFPHDGPVAATETVFDRVSVEIARGCTEGCRFCQAGMIYRPVRERDPEEVVRTIRCAVQSGGYDEASLTSLSTADYSAISPLVRTLAKELDDERVAVSVSSLRAYGLGEDVLDEMQRTRAAGLTFAPEAGTQRMRDVVNKNVTEAQLLTTAERVFSRGWTKMKLYFMIGLPTEEDEDVRGIVQTGARAMQVGEKILGRRTPRVTVSVSTHVPKPHTPFQWCAMDAQADVVRKQALLRAEVRGSGLQLRMHESNGSWLEGVLARGDRSLARVISHAYDRGARFDSWDERLVLDAWQEAFTTYGVDPNRFLGTIPVTARLPWDHIDVGLEDGFLAREYRRALRNRLSPPCGKAVGMFIHHTNTDDARKDQRKLVCYNCGVACDMTAMREERIVFLERLTARQGDSPPPPKNPPRVPDASPSKPHKLRRPFFDLDQGPTAKVRLGFTKLGRIAYSSHLDLVRLLPRLFRRAGLKLYYSRGFNPHPEITFSPALSLGIQSLAEYLDVKLCVPGENDLDGLLDRLNEASIEGVRFFGAHVLERRDPSLGKVIDEITYVAALPRAALSCDPSALQERIDVRRTTNLEVRRNVKGIGRTINVSRYLLEARVGEDDDVLAAAGFVGDAVPVRVSLRIDPSGTAKPQEALSALLDPDVEALFVRTGVFGHAGELRVTPLDLDALRFTPLASLATGEVTHAP